LRSIWPKKISPPQYIVEEDTDDEPIFDQASYYYDLGMVDNTKIASILANAATYYYMTSEDCFRAQAPEEVPSSFSLKRRYSVAAFQGIRPNTGTAVWSTAGIPQFRALARQDPSVKLDISMARKVQIMLGQGHPSYQSDPQLYLRLWDL
jgi:hypothetical protein